MSVLKNHKHEIFACGLANGLTSKAAFAKAGYAPNRANAARLKANELIQARVKELLAKTASKIIKGVALDARSIFAKLDKAILLAQEAGNHKAAIDGIGLMLECFGYRDSPTLTHEHVHGKGLSGEEAGPKADAPHRFSRLSATLLDFKRNL